MSYLYIHTHTHTHTHTHAHTRTHAHTHAEAQLQALDRSYALRAEEEKRRCQHSLDERLAAYQRECDAHSRAEREREMAVLREGELKRVREEERERWQGEVGRKREELEGKHGAKMAALRQTELETMERLRRKEQVGEGHCKRGGAITERDGSGVLDTLSAFHVHV